MRALARVLLEKGWRLSGSDPAITMDDPLLKAGVCCFSAHAAQQLSGDVECVIHSSAISAANPELRRAIELRIPVHSYAEMLGQLMQGRHGLAVAGTHGKSTATAMAAEILVAAGCDPTESTGMPPEAGTTAAGQTKGTCRSASEACEFCWNFLLLRPHDAVILFFDVQDYRVVGAKVQEIPAKFTSLDENGMSFACPAAVVPASGGSAVDYRRIAARGHEDFGGHGRGGRLAVGPGDRQAVTPLHQLAEHLGIAVDRNAEFYSAAQFGIGGRNGTAVDHALDVPA